MFALLYFLCYTKPFLQPLKPLRFQNKPAEVIVYSARAACSCWLGSIKRIFTSCEPEYIMKFTPGTILYLPLRHIITLEQDTLTSVQNTGECASCRGGCVNAYNIGVRVYRSQRVRWGFYKQRGEAICWIEIMMWAADLEGWGLWRKLSKYLVGIHHFHLLQWSQTCSCNKVACTSKHAVIELACVWEFSNTTLLQVYVWVNRRWVHRGRSMWSWWCLCFITATASDTAAEPCYEPIRRFSFNLTRSSESKMTIVHLLKEYVVSEIQSERVWRKELFSGFSLYTAKGAGQFQKVVNLQSQKWPVCLRIRGVGGIGYYCTFAWILLSNRTAHIQSWHIKTCIRPLNIDRFDFKQGLKRHLL